MVSQLRQATEALGALRVAAAEVEALVSTPSQTAAQAALALAGRFGLSNTKSLPAPAARLSPRVG